MKQPKNSLQLPKSTADTRKIQNKLMTVGSGKKKTYKLRLSLSHREFKAAMSAHSIYS